MDTPMSEIASGISGHDPGPPPAPRRPARVSISDLAAAVALIAALLLLYHQVLRLWWTHDDLFNLHYVSEHHPWQYCLEPHIWRLLPLRMLTPLLFLSLHLDLRLFGAEPQAQYAHQLAAARRAFLAFYALLRLWLSPAPAALGTGIALTGAPTASLVLLPMTRHYLEGLFPAALSIALLFRALAPSTRGTDPLDPPAARRLDPSRAPSAAGHPGAAGRGWVGLFLSRVCSLAACLAKEVFVPLVLFFPCLAPGGAGQRLRLSAPHLGAFLFYLGWRLYMLGTLGGGYGWGGGGGGAPARC